MRLCSTLCNLTGSVLGITFQLVIVLSLLNNACGLHEDQAGKFDWHLKLLGPLDWAFVDPGQPKRILLGTETSVAAINVGNGNVLYRHHLDGNLLSLHLSESRVLTAISNDLSADTNPKVKHTVIKRRKLAAHNGIEIDSSAFPVEDAVLQASVSNSVEDRLYVLTKGLQIHTFSSKGKQATVQSPCGENSLLVSDFLVCEDKVLDIASGKTKQGLFKNPRRVTGSVNSVVVDSTNGKLTLLDLATGTSTTLEENESVISYDASTKIYASSVLETSLKITQKYYSLTGESVEKKTEAIITDAPLSGLRLTLNANGVMTLVMTTDLQLLGFRTDEKNPAWSTEQSLRNVVAVEMVDLPNMEQSGVRFPSLTYSAMNVISAFFARITMEIMSAVESVNYLSRSTSATDRFGLRKIIVFVTKVGKVVAMESTGSGTTGGMGNFVYSFFIRDFGLFQNGNAFLYILRQAKYDLEPVAVIVYRSKTSGSTMVYSFDPVSGKPLARPEIYPEILQLQLTHHHHDEQFMRKVVMLDKQLRVHCYPACESTEKLDNLYFNVLYNDDATKTERLVGYRVQKNNRAIELWSINLPHKVLSVERKSPLERVHSQGRVLPDRSVSYKYLNPNAVLVVMHHQKQEESTIELWMIDAITGNILSTLTHKKATPPFHAILSEHFLVYTLWSERYRRTELNGIEFYEGATQSNSTTFSSFNGLLPVKTLKQSYIFPHKINQISITITEKGITSKDVLIAFNGKILALPRMVLAPKVTMTSKKVVATEDDAMIQQSIPYQPELPVLSEMVVNYNQTIGKVDNIKVWSTKLESTCLLLVTGSDLFFTKLTPSKTFDVLKDDFDHWFITVVLAGLVLSAWITKRLSARKQLEQKWK